MEHIDGGIKTPSTASDAELTGTPMRTALRLGFALLLTLPSWSSAEIYRWTDAEGRVHFTQDLSQVPLAHRAEAEQSAAAPRVDRLQTYSTPPANADASVRRRLRRPRFGELLRIPFEKRGDMMIVEVTLNDRVSAPFLVDTGASDVSIPAELAARLGIQVGPDTPYRRYQTANGIVVNPIITLDSVQAGEARLEQVSASISSTMGVGLLGGAFFNNFTFQVDPAASMIAVVLNDRVRAGRSEDQWRREFQHLRAELARLERYIEENHFTRESRVAGLEEKRAELEDELRALEEEADRAEVPQAWRD
jgi:clan AA aspartic protease (TIGR02281 family)